VESNSNGATRPVAKDAEGDGDQRNAINPSEKRNRSPLRTRATLGPLTKLEDHVPADWWERQFDALYLKTDGDVVEDADITRREIDIFLRLLPLNPEAKILDLCCGQGRHVLEFCRRGFGKVEGFDRSSFLLSEAKERAKFEKLLARFCEGDARILPYVAETFDAVFILGNSFGYFACAEDDCAMLQEAHRVLRPAGRLLLDVTDGEYLKIHYAPRSWEWIDATMFACRERELSTDGDRLVSREIITDIERGVVVDRFYAERLYSLEKLRQLLTRAGFCLAKVYFDLITGSARNQDLGMMARRIVLMSCKT
jgi:D-alanine-D-alanine ligase